MADDELLFEDVVEEGAIKEGYIKDYISGKPVKETPEERDAVQVFARTLVEDYAYPKTHIRTRPQWRVRARPSDTKKEYPVDIAVFNSDDHDEDNLFIVVECKKKTRKDGKLQLQDYLRFSNARVGVWFNGSERLFLQKYEQKGKVYFQEISNIPRYGQRIEDVGKFIRKDLKPASNLRSVFKAIRNYLAANAVGITRDEVFAQQIINILFCKIYDERYTKPENMVQFRAGIDESEKDIKDRVESLFAKVKKSYNDVIEVADTILLDERSLAYVVGELQMYAITENDRDAVADAFEIFIGPSLKGSQGQFFTPRNVVQMVVDIVDPGPQHRILDPACGSGGFLVEALRHVWKKVDEEGREYDWPQHEVEAEKSKVATKHFFGIDKDNFLAKVAKAYMAILGDGRGGVYCENTLERPVNWSKETNIEIQKGKFDIILTNPPFGKKLAIDSEDILKQYDLGHAWKKEAAAQFTRGDVLDKQTPQILFIERCLDLLKEGGHLGIVLLESIFGMPKYEYVVDYILRNTKVKAIITLPEDLFQPYTHAKTCVVVLEKNKPEEEYDIFMCDVKWCGHDSRGNPTYRTNSEGKRVLLDEIPTVAEEFWKGAEV